MILTAYDSVWAKFKELVFKLLPQSLDVLLLGLIRLLEALGIRRRDVMIMLMIKDPFIWAPTRGMIGKGERSNRIAMERELSGNKVGPLRLVRLEEVLRNESELALQRAQ